MNKKPKKAMTTGTLDNPECVDGIFASNDLAVISSQPIDFSEVDLTFEKDKWSPCNEQ